MPMDPLPPPAAPIGADIGPFDQPAMRERDITPSLASNPRWRFRLHPEPSVRRGVHIFL